VNLKHVANRFAVAQEYRETKHRFSGELKAALEDSVADIPDLLGYISELQGIIRDQARAKTW
jgi:hypothetical protein